jgi:hypothetical protein
MAFLTIRGGNGGHGRARVVTFVLQIEPWRRVVNVRECPRVLSLMYPSRTRVLLSARKTDNESDLLITIGRRGARRRPLLPTQAAESRKNASAARKFSSSLSGRATQWSISIRRARLPPRCAVRSSGLADGIGSSGRPFATMVFRSARSASRYAAETVDPPSCPIVAAASKREDLHVQVSDDARVCTELAGYRTESLRALPEIAIEAVVVVRGAAERV